MVNKKTVDKLTRKSATRTLQDSAAQRKLNQALGDYGGSSDELDELLEEVAACETTVQIKQDPFTIRQDMDAWRAKFIRAHVAEGRELKDGEEWRLVSCFDNALARPSTRVDWTSNTAVGKVHVRRRHYVEELLVAKEQCYPLPDLTSDNDAQNWDHLTRLREVRDASFDRLFPKRTESRDEIFYGLTERSQQFVLDEMRAAEDDYIESLASPEEQKKCQDIRDVRDSLGNFGDFELMVAVFLKCVIGYETEEFQEMDTSKKAAESHQMGFIDALGLSEKRRAAV